MSKEITKHTCPHCESSYKLLFDLNTTSGFPRFCPFCSGETYDDDLVPEEDEDWVKYILSRIKDKYTL